MGLNTIHIDELIQSLNEMRKKYPHAEQVAFRVCDDERGMMYTRDCYLVQEDVMCVDAKSVYDYDIIYDDEDYFKEDHPDMEWQPTSCIVFDLD